MKVEPIYPPVKKRSRAGARFRTAVNWSFGASAFACALINIFTGGAPWCLVADWGLWFAWSAVISPSLVERNRISLTSKILVDACVLLILIDSVYPRGWAGFVVPIVCFASLAAIGTLFLSDLPRQKQNMMPMFWLIIASFVAVIGAFSGWPKLDWPMIVLGCTRWRFSSSASRPCGAA
jgi:hypothetical protein